ncbi:hypothetical protein WT01_25820 [Burkholderia cepacia]|nr:hypothetical protein WS93_25435 [Burkholderia cepacia]KVL53827.1 hypothetical protein WT01_25820 [Burkholderia cepacia]
MTLRELSASLAELLERESSDTAREIQHLYRIIRNAWRKRHDARRRRLYYSSRRFEGGDFGLVTLLPSTRIIVTILRM